MQPPISQYLGLFETGPWPSLVEEIPSKGACGDRQGLLGLECGSDDIAGLASVYFLADRRLNVECNLCLEYMPSIVLLNIEFD